MFKKLYDNKVLWQMETGDRLAIFYILANLKRRHYAVEVGTYKGGLLKELVKAFNKVASIDIDHSQVDNKDTYKNAEWIERDSSVGITKALTNEAPDLLVIDGSHSYEGVKQDIRLALSHHNAPGIILVHDAAYPPAKKALEEIKTNYFVDLNFVPGVKFGETQIGGFALFVNTEVYNDFNKNWRMWKKKYVKSY